MFLCSSYKISYNFWYGDVPVNRQLDGTLINQFSGKIVNHVPFDVIFLETHKNYEQMQSIIQKCKEHTYVNINGIFVREGFLEN